MKTLTPYSPEFASVILRRLRPLDISVGVHILEGSLLKPTPSISKLCEPGARLFWLAALTSYAQSQSHSGLFLDPSISVAEFLGVDAPEIAEMSMSLVEFLGDGDALCVDYPEHVAHPEALSDHSRAYFVYRPDAKLIYLQRWFRLEAKLGSFLRERLERPSFEMPEGFATVFQAFFPLQSIQENPWQAAASFTAARHDFSIITGGPGTGKTTTVTRLIGLLLSLPEDQRPRSVNMVAPTGKAAERLRESFTGNFEKMLDGLPQDQAAELSALGEKILGPASTIHSFLGSMGGKGFRYNKGNPQECDVLIVDESSMVDLELFIALFDALSKECRIILLGDKNQLAAVGTGNVFADLTGTQESRFGNLNVSSAPFREAFEAVSGRPLPDYSDCEAVCGDRVVELTHSYRFTGTSSVGQLAQMLFKESRLPHKGEFGVESLTLEEDWKRFLLNALEPYYTCLRDGGSVLELLEQINQIRILCAVRGGDQGVEAINKLLGEAILGHGVNTSLPQHGLPFIIRSNDKLLGLANGDCGVFYRGSDGEIEAYLPDESGEQPLRALNPFALPDWEPAFALTIHKSQGSEYRSVVVVLPELTRAFISWELVYTAITRGKKEVSLVMPERLLGHPLERIERKSGLRYELL